MGIRSLPLCILSLISSILSTVVIYLDISVIYCCLTSLHQYFLPKPQSNQYPRFDSPCTFHQNEGLRPLLFALHPLHRRGLHISMAMAWFIRFRFQCTGPTRQEQKASETAAQTAAASTGDAAATTAAASDSASDSASASASTSDSESASASITSASE